MLLYRDMVKGDDGYPELGYTTKLLGVRIQGQTVDHDCPHFDITSDAYGVVHPETGGLSVTPPEIEDTISSMSAKRIRKTKTVLWCIDDSELGSHSLYFRADPNNPCHGFIEPLEPMDGSDYNQGVQSTQKLWREVDVSNII